MQLADLQVILKVAKFRSITDAAASLNMQTATASAAIKRVERTLGADLFIRTTRSLRLSSAGERYIPHCLLCASPDYLARQGMPKHPHDLVKYHGLFYQISDIIHDVWHFSHNDDKFKIKMRGNRAGNDGDLVRRWCVAGHGLATKSALDVASNLLSGDLVNVLPDYHPTATELWIICPSRQSITPAVRLLRDTFRTKCQTILLQLVNEGILTSDVLT